MFKALTGTRSMTVVFFMCVLAQASAFAQQRGDRILAQMPSEPGRQSPVEIVAIKVKGETVEPGERFSAGDDWLLGLTFTLKNVSDKSISCVEVGLIFLTPAGSRTKYASYGLRYGYCPVIRGAAAAAGTPRPIMPGETLDLELSTRGYQSVLNLLIHAGVSTNVEAAKYEIDMVFFEGDADTMWRHGLLFRRDPLHPKAFNVVGPYVLAKRPE